MPSFTVHTDTIKKLEESLAVAHARLVQRDLEIKALQSRVQSLEKKSRSDLPVSSPPPAPAQQLTRQEEQPLVYLSPLSDDEKDSCIRLDICFRCRQHGHKSYDKKCPNNNWRAKSRSRLPRPRQPTQKSRIDDLTARLAELEKTHSQPLPALSQSPPPVPAKLASLRPATGTATIDPAAFPTKEALDKASAAKAAYRAANPSPPPPAPKKTPAKKTRMTRKNHGLGTQKSTRNLRRSTRNRQLNALGMEVYDADEDSYDSDLSDLCCYCNNFKPCSC